MFAIAVFFAIVAIVLTSMGTTKIDEGFVGVAILGGAVKDGLLEPGYHFTVPLLQQVQVFPISLQTAMVENVPCGTSSGIVIDFERIEIVFQLRKHHLLETVRNYSTSYMELWIDDLVRHAVNEICSVNSLQDIYIEKFASIDDMIVKSLQQTHVTWAPGISVITARTTKPKIPRSIEKNYEAIEEQRTELLIREQEQKNILKTAETRGRKEINAAEKEASIMKMTTAQNIAEKEAEAEISTINIEIELSRAKAQADAKHERDLQRAEANARKLTPQYLKMKRALAELQGTKMYFGQHVPDKIIDGQSTGLELNELH